MPYHKTDKKTRIDAKYRRMRDAKARKREQQVVEPRSHELPRLRRVVIVLDFDFGLVVNVFRFWKTRRVDSYNMAHDDNAAECMGWSIFCKRLSTHFPRVLSDRNL